MSYNIDSVDTLVLDAFMYAKDVVELCDEDELPEGCFLDDMEGPARDAVASQKTHEKIDLPHFGWYGEGSGHSYQDALIKIVAPKIRGTVEAVFTWEGGDSLSGLRIRDGAVEECDVERTLVPRKGKRK